MSKSTKTCICLLLTAVLGSLVYYSYLPSRQHPALETHGTMTVEQKTFTSELYGSGTLEPAHTVAVTAPVEGTVLKVLFRYGEPVKAGQPLFILSSQKGLADYRRALTDYIKADTAAAASRRQLDQNRLLHQKQLIADNEFRASANTWYQDRLSLLQARAALDSLLRQMNAKDEIPEHLTMRDAKKVSRALHIQDDALQITVTAPANGSILTPARGGNKHETAHLFEPGDAVKQGDVLALTGDTHLLKVTIPVSEFNIKDLHTGMTATLTGPAFSDITLQGRITHIRPEATAGTDGAPSFPVEVTVPLQTAAASRILPGMSAEVTILLKQEPAVLIPPDAVLQTAAGSQVLLKDPLTHAIRAVPVQTGRTNETNVVIRSGLRPGDQIVVSDKA